MQLVPSELSISCWDATDTLPRQLDYVEDSAAAPRITLACASRNGFPSKQKDSLELVDVYGKALR
jgi:hypothetical protein